MESSLKAHYGGCEFF